MTSGLTVFLCSTFSDLSDERDRVLNAIRELQLEHDSMEFFGARTEQPLETCLYEVRRSNILVVIVGHTYGTLVPDQKISFSEAEYNEGFTLGKPCLVYMRDDNIPVLPKHMERDADKLALLNKWRQTLRDRHTVATFQASADLAAQVMADLGRTMSDLEQASQSTDEAQRDSPVGLHAEVSGLLDAALAEGAEERPLLSSIRRAVSEIVAKTQDRGATVFLSYAYSDHDIVMQVAGGLRGRGFRLWERSSLSPGADVVGAIQRGLDVATFVIVFISKKSVESRWVQHELQLALALQLEHGNDRPALLPVLLEDADVPPLLRAIIHVDMRDGNAARATQQLVDIMRRHRSLMENRG